MPPPIGYPKYAAADFMNWLGVPTDRANLIAEDHSTLLTFDAQAEVVRVIFDAGPNLFVLTNLLMERYSMKRKPTGKVALFFAFVANARSTQMRWLKLGIDVAIWMTPGDACPSHAELNNKRYDPQKGIQFGGKYLLPSVSIGCKCTGRPIVAGFH